MAEKGKEKLGCLPCFLISLVLTVIFMVCMKQVANSSNYQDDGSIIIFGVVICLLLWVAIFAFRMAVLTSRAKKEGKKMRAERHNKEVALKAEKGYWDYGTFKHTAGLPLAEGVECRVEYYNDKINIEGSGTNFSLSFDKVSDIAVKTDKEIQKSYVSSAGGAVVGGYLFGPVGAMIGGRAKEKTSAVLTHYLIITYTSDNEIKYIGLEIPTGEVSKSGIWTNELSKAQEWEKHFKNSNHGKQTNTIEL